MYTIKEKVHTVVSLRPPSRHDEYIRYRGYNPSGLAKFGAEMNLPDCEFGTVPTRTAQLQLLPVPVLYSIPNQEDNVQK